MIWWFRYDTIIMCHAKYAIKGPSTILLGHPVCVHAVRRKSNRNDCTRISVSRSLGPI